MNVCLHILHKCTGALIRIYMRVCTCLQQHRISKLPDWVQLRDLSHLYDASCYPLFQWSSASLWSETDQGSSVMPIRNYIPVMPDLLGRTAGQTDFIFCKGYMEESKRSGQLGFTVQLGREFRGRQFPADLRRQPAKRTSNQDRTDTGGVKSLLLSTV